MGSEGEALVEDGKGLFVEDVRLEEKVDRLAKLEVLKATQVVHVLWIQRSRYQILQVLLELLESFGTLEWPW